MNIGNGNYSPLLKRNLSQEILDSLEEFIVKKQKVGGDYGWISFYKFIVVAYKAEQHKRPSISQLSNILKSRGIKNSGDLAVLYAHCLYVLALNEGLTIYYLGFNP